MLKNGIKFIIAVIAIFVVSWMFLSMFAKAQIQNDCSRLDDMINASDISLQPQINYCINEELKQINRFMNFPANTTFAENNDVVIEVIETNINNTVVVK